MYPVKRLRVCERVMTPHCACTSVTSRVLTVTSLQRFKVEALIPAPADGDVRSVMKFLNAGSIAPIEIHCRLCQHSFPANVPFVVSQNCNRSSVVQKIVRHVITKAIDTRTQSKTHGVSMTGQLYSVPRKMCTARLNKFMLQKLRISLSMPDP